MGLVSELRRRNVFRMAVLYVVAAWLIMQVAEVVVSLANLPEWVGPTILVLLAIGFPIALIFSWFYELTPEGIALESDVETSESITHVTGRRMDFVVISLLCAAVILFAYDKWWVGPPPEKSIAVLAFENMSADPQQEYFADGLSDTLIHVLAQVSGLKVTAKTSTFHFKGKNMNVEDIARELNVSNILEGSVQRDGGRVRVIAQLINAEDGTHLWSKSFDRDLEDLFAVQDEIAMDVVSALRVTLLDDEQNRLEQRYQPPIEAYDQLIVGRHELSKRTAESLAAAERHFKRAIELDPDYALAYVDLAETYVMQVNYSGLLFEDSLQRQQTLIDKALALDPLSGEAHAASALLRYYQQLKTGDIDSSAIDDEFLKGIKLNPNYARARHQYSLQLSGQGRFEEALEQIRIAAELDPMSPIIQLTVSSPLWSTGRVEEALSVVRRNIERYPDFPNSYGAMALIQAQLGRLGEALWWTQEARKRNPENAYAWVSECLCFLNLGDLGSAEDCVKQLGAAHPEKVPALAMRAELQQYRGERNAAIATLQPLAERVPGFRPFTRWLADLIAGEGDFERASRLMADTFPELLDDGLELSADDMDAALVFAAILHANGETHRRDVLLMAVEEQIAKMHRVHGIGYGILDVYVHAMRGDRNRAIAGLREAIDMGWRVDWPRPRNISWWSLRNDWKLEGLHQDPEFVEVVDELEADIRRQRESYEDQKGGPLSTGNQYAVRRVADDYSDRDL